MTLRAGEVAVAGRRRGAGRIAAFSLASRESRAAWRVPGDDGDVPGLDVAMNDDPAVRGIEGIGDLARQFQQPIEINGSAAK